MATSFTIRIAKSAEDMDAVRALNAAYAGTLTSLGYPNFEADTMALPAYYRAADAALLLARGADGVPLGCGALRPFDAPARCEMKRVYVQPAARGRSLGRALVMRLIAEARRRGYSAILLDTLPELTAAQALYRSVGFTEIEAYYPPPVEGMLFMELRLRGRASALPPVG